MKTAKLVKPGKIEIMEVAAPRLQGPKDVLVRVKAVGICGTDLHIFRGERADVALPRVMGHELSGVVEETGSEVTRMKQGDRVVLDPVFACDTCRICKSGHQNVCADVKCFGVQMDGGFQEYIVVEEQHLYPFSKEISFEKAALAEPFSIASNIVSRAAVAHGDRVVVLGSGTIGLCVAQVAGSLGAKVLVSDIEDAKLAKAKAAGADVTVNTGRESLAEVMAQFSPEGADVVVDAVGLAALTTQAIALTAPLARVVVIGFDGKPAQISPVDVTKKELTIVGSRMNCHQFGRVMDWLEKDKIHADFMVTGSYPLEQIQRAFEETLANGKQVVKTMITI